MKSLDKLYYFLTYPVKIRWEKGKLSSYIYYSTRLRTLSQVKQSILSMIFTSVHPSTKQCDYYFIYSQTTNLNINKPDSIWAISTEPGGLKALTVIRSHYIARSLVASASLIRTWSRVQWSLSLSLSPMDTVAFSRWWANVWGVCSLDGDVHCNNVVWALKTVHLKVPFTITVTYLFIKSTNSHTSLN